MDGSGSSVAERPEAGDGVTLTAEGTVSASLSVSMGAYIYINLRLEAYIAVVVIVSGEAGVRWEAKVGADLALCGAATTSGLTGLCENLNTQLTPYIEYEPDQVALAQTQGSGYSVYAQIGVWVYVPYPQVSVSIGITFPGSESLAACLGVPTGIDWSSNFGSPDDQIGDAHPFGNFIIRRAIAKTLAFSNDNTAIQPLGPEFEYVSPPIAPSKCRFEFTQSRGGTARSQWQLSEIRLYESSGSQLSVTDCVSNVGGDKNAQEGSLKLIDGSVNTKNCCSTSSTNVVVTLTLSPSITSAVASYKLYTANDMPSRDPISWTFSCEHGDGVYEVLDQQTGVSAPNDRKTAYPTYRTTTGWDHEFDFRGCSDSTPVVDARNSAIVATAMNGAMCSAEGMVLDGSNDYVAVTPWEFGGAMTMESISACARVEQHLPFTLGTLVTPLRSAYTEPTGL